MTKIVRWYKRMSFWNWALLVLTPITTGEVVAYFKDVTLPTWVHVVVGFCCVLALAIKIFNPTDVNKNGIVDQFEDDKG